jgi:hypothetical protein
LLSRHFSLFVPGLHTKLNHRLRYNNTYYDWKCTAILWDRRHVLWFNALAVSYSMLPVIMQQTTARDAAILMCTVIRCSNQPCRTTLLWLSFSLCDPLRIHFKLLSQ